MQANVRMSEAVLEFLLARAAEERARRALTDVGLGGKEAALAINDMGSLWSASISCVAPRSRPPSTSSRPGS
jgi:hypothetical protein